MATVTDCSLYIHCEGCPDADLDYCEGVKRLKKEERDSRVAHAIKYLNENGFKYEDSRTDNIVYLIYPGQKYRFSLNHFKLASGNSWKFKYKGKLIKQGTTLKFGRYAGMKLKDITNTSYINWLITSTDMMIQPPQEKGTSI